MQQELARATLQRSTGVAGPWARLRVPLGGLRWTGPGPDPRSLQKESRQGPGGRVALGTRGAGPHWARVQALLAGHSGFPACRAHPPG